MKSSLLVATISLAFVAAGCGQKDNQSQSSAAPAKAEASAPQAATSVEVTGGDNMKFSLTRIEAPANTDFKITLVNIGTQPKEVMGHNLVILKPGSDVNAYAAAALTAKANDYIPENLNDQVVAHTPLLGPRKSADITVNLPPGEYPYLCSFPAHAQVGMKGVLVVK